MAQKPHLRVPPLNYPPFKMLLRVSFSEQKSLERMQDWLHYERSNINNLFGVIDAENLHTVYFK